jgi:hypothetical protein
MIIEFKRGVMPGRRRLGAHGINLLVREIGPKQRKTGQPFLVTGRNSPDAGAGSSIDRHRPAISRTYRWQATHPAPPQHKSRSPSGK